MSEMLQSISPARTILSAICIVYIFAFGSYYYQFPGLYGPKGILPSNWYSDSDDVLATMSQWIPGGIQRNCLLEMLSLIGLVVAVLSVAFRPVRGVTSFLIMYTCYLLCQKHGGVFMYYQWDTLLLESGFLCMLLACPLFDSDIVIFLLRWLTFRLMFCSGAVKLLTGCPLWWALKATSVHYQSQCLPTITAYFFHHLPLAFHQLSDALTFIVMLGFSWPAILPFKRLANISFTVNVFLQLIIFATGNFNFINLLTITLCYSLLHTSTMDKSDDSSPSSIIWNILCNILSYAVIPIGLTAFALYHLFGLRVNEQERQLTLKVAFTDAQFSQFVDISTAVAVCIAAFTLFVKIAQAFLKSIAESQGKFSTIISFYRSLVTSIIVILIFANSLVTLSQHSVLLSSHLPPQIYALNDRLSGLHFSNSYGLFSRMTGANGRSELIIEGTNDNITWHEYEFFYKPGNVSVNPTQAAPYQPRLDWQMWFAALSESETQGWYLNFVYRLLEGSSDVLSLLKCDPFNGTGPRIIRTMQYNYKYTSRSDANWWTRIFSHMWHLPVGIDDTVFDDLKRLDREKQPVMSDHWTTILASLRRSVSSFSGFQFCVGLALIALVTGKIYDMMFPVRQPAEK